MSNIYLEHNIHASIMYIVKEEYGRVYWRVYKSCIEYPWRESRFDSMKELVENSMENSLLTMIPYNKLTAIIYDIYLDENGDNI